LILVFEFCHLRACPYGLYIVLLLLTPIVLNTHCAHIHTHCLPTIQHALKLNALHNTHMPPSICTLYSTYTIIPHGAAACVFPVNYWRNQLD